MQTGVTVDESAEKPLHVDLPADFLICLATNIKDILKEIRKMNEHIEEILGRD